MPSDESKGSQLDAIGSLAQRQLDNTGQTANVSSASVRSVLGAPGHDGKSAREEPITLNDLLGPVLLSA